jgi:O-antigen/teichoic acid export membrane protein
VFGRGFAAGAAVTVVLAIGQMVSAAAGPCGSVLNMSGRVLLNMVDNVGALVLNVGLNVWLIPRYGVTGAAWAWSISLILVNAVKVLQVRNILHVRSAGAGWGKTLLAAVPAAGVGALVAWQTTNWLMSVILGVAAVTVTFVGCLAVLGIGDEDRAIVRSAVHRISGGLRPRPLHG